jgi:hypothetical protein
MKRNVKLKNMLAIAGLLAISGMAHASDTVQDIEIPSSTRAYTNGSKSYMLVINDSSADKKPSATVSSLTQPEKFEPPFFSGSNAHKYLGLGTLALVVATAIAPKPGGDATTQAGRDEQDSSVHAKLGEAAAVMAAATVTTGLIYHWDDFHLEDGFSDPDNLHALLGSVGALALLYAVSQAPATEHAGVGAAGGVAMGFAIKLTW